MARLLTIHILEDAGAIRGSASFSGDAIASRRLTAAQAAEIWRILGLGTSAALNVD